MNKKISQLIFLGIFLFMTLFIHFLHTEKSLSDNDTCPACHFQNSTLLTNQINFFCLPPLSILEILKTFESQNIDHLFFIIPSSRSPPQA